MADRRIWKVVLATTGLTALVIVVATFDPGFLRTYAGGGVVAVSTGERAEILVVTAGPMGWRSGTEIYWLEADGTFEKAATFDPPAHCVTALDGRLFVTFRDQSSGIIEDGRWVRGVARPSGFRIHDVAPLDGVLHAFSMANGTVEPFRPGSGIRVMALTEDGWQAPAPDYDVEEKSWFMGCVEVDEGIRVLYAQSEERLAGVPDIEKAEWFHVLFDGSGWRDKVRLTLPEKVFPGIGAYQGRLAFTLVPIERGEPVNVAFETDGSLDVVAEIPPVDNGRFLSGWLVSFAGRHSVILSGPGSAWVVWLEDFVASEPVRLLEISPAAKVRSRIYVGLLAIAAVMLVALGIAWLVMRLSSMKGNAT